MSKIAELNLKDTYRLVDVDGYTSSYVFNNVYLKKYPELLTGFKLALIDEGYGNIKDGTCIIGSYEYKFFEKVDIETVKAVYKNKENIMKELTQAQSFVELFNSINDRVKRVVCWGLDLPKPYKLVTDDTVELPDGSQFKIIGEGHVQSLSTLLVVVGS